MKKPIKNLFKSSGCLGAIILLLLTPIYFTHAESALFSITTQGTWQYDSGFRGNSVYYYFITNDGAGSSSIDAASRDTGIPSKTKVEIFLADTKGGIFSDSCSSSNFTGDPATDFACVAAAAQTQGYSYEFGQTWQAVVAAQVSPQTSTSPCKCP